MQDVCGYDLGPFVHKAEQVQQSGSIPIPVSGERTLGGRCRVCVAGYVIACAPHGSLSFEEVASGGKTAGGSPLSDIEARFYRTYLVRLYLGITNHTKYTHGERTGSRRR